MEEKIKGTVNGQEVKNCEATVNEETNENAATQPAVIPQKEGRLRKIGRACWNNRGKIGAMIGGALTFVVMCVLDKDESGNDTPSDGPTE